MPELPEVETFARQIRPLVLNKPITTVTVTPKGERMIAPLSPAELTAALPGNSFSALKRHGKFLIFELADNKQIVAHLRMSGRLVITSKKPSRDKHNRLWIAFEDGSILNFLDTRRFGTFQLIGKPGDHKGLNQLGPDALDPAWTPRTFHKALQKFNKAIYKVLLDQSAIAGIGNIYANEALFRSKIHPLSPAKALSEKQAGNLLHNIIDILSTALEFKGTTLIDSSYRDSEGSAGEFRTLLQVYGKAGNNCVNCAEQIRRIRIGGRSVFYCQNCQKA